MKTKTFTRLFCFILILCALITLIHMGYTVYAYSNSSIIRFIANELWIF
ncbi:MAG: hypothetical protein MJ153_08155 [Clostridia bacterium]|nr:hypothetical protein [Clostridia bacterium]